MTNRALAVLLSILIAAEPGVLFPIGAFAQVPAPQASVDPPLQRLAKANDALKSEFAAATLSPISVDPLEREVKAARSSDPAVAGALTALKRSADLYNSFRSRFLSLPPDALVQEVRKTGRLLGVAPEQAETAVSRYQQLQATLLQNGITWRDGQFVKSNGKPFTSAEFAAFLGQRSVRLDARSIQTLAASNQELVGIQSLAQSNPDEAVKRLDRLLYGLSSRPDLLEKAQGSVPLETTLALVQQTYNALGPRYQTQVSPNLQAVDRQIQQVLARKIRVPAPAGPGAPRSAPPTPLATKFQLSFYGALSALPLTSAWARERFFAIQAADTLRQNADVSGYTVGDKDPWGRPRKGAYIAMKDGSRRYESADGLVVITSADGRRAVTEDRSKGTYSQTLDNQEILSWTRDPRTGALSGRFRGMAFDVKPNENLILAPDSNTLLVAKGFDKEGKPVIDRWLGLNHERGFELPGGIGEARSRMEGDQFHKDVILRPATLLAALMNGKGLDLSAVPPQYLDPAARGQYERFVKQLPQFGALFADAFAGTTAGNAGGGTGGAGAQSSLWVESFYFRDGQMHLVIGEKGGAAGAAAAPSYNHQIVAVPDAATGGIKVFVMAGSTTFLWKMNAEGTRLDQYRPDVEAQGEGRAAFELARRMEQRDGRWVMTQNLPAQVKEYTTWDAVKAVGGSFVQGIGEGVGILFSPIDAALKGVVGGIWLAGGAIGSAVSRESAAAAFSKVAGVYTMRQAKFNEWLGQGTRGEAQILDAYRQAQSVVNGRTRKDLEALLDSEVEKARRKAYGELYQLHERDPITDKDRAYAAARVFGLDNLAGQYMEAGKESIQKGGAGNAALGALNYGAAVVVVGGQAYVQGFGLGLAATPLKAMAVGSRFGLTGEQVVAAAAQVSQRGEAALALSSNAVRAGRAFNLLGNLEMGVYLAPGAAGAGSDLIGLYQAWSREDRESAWEHFNGFFSNAAGFSAMGLGLVQSRLSAFAASRSARGQGPSPADARLGEQAAALHDTAPGAGPDASAEGGGRVSVPVVPKPATVEPQPPAKPGTVPDKASVAAASKPPELPPEKTGTAPKPAAAPPQKPGKVPKPAKDPAEIFRFERYFSREEFLNAHREPEGSSIYHDWRHSLRVPRMAEDFAQARGLAPADVKFIGEVALLHDFDPPGVKAPMRDPGTPARVPETLGRLKKDFSGELSLTGEPGKSVLRERFGWDERQLKIAEAMIQRTEFPFGDLGEKEYRPHYKGEGNSPSARYQRMLEGLSPGDRRFALREGAYLSEYADKASHYSMEGFGGALNVVEGLVGEINAANPKAGMDAGKLGTYGFLSAVGAPESFALDRSLARRLQIGNFELMGRDQAFALMPKAYGEAFRGNLAGFKAFDEALKQGKPPAEAARIAAAAAAAPQAPASPPSVVGRLEGVSRMSAEEAGRAGADPNLARDLLIQGTRPNSLESPAAREYNAAVQGNRMGVIARLQTQWKEAILAKGAEAAAGMGAKPNELISHGTTLQGLLGMVVSGGLEATSSYSGMSGESSHFWGGNGLEVGAGYAAKRGLAKGQPGVLVILRNPSLKVVQGETLSRRPVVDGDFAAAVIYDGKQAVVLDRQALQALARSAKAWQDGAVQAAHRGSMKAFDEWERVRDRLVPR